MIFNNNINIMSKEEMLMVEIREFEQSKKVALMATAEKYYAAENEEISNRVIVRKSSIGEQEDNTKPNNKLIHAFLHNHIDEKVGYLLSKEPTLNCEDEVYVSRVKEVLGKYFFYKLMNLGVKASINGVAWLHPYIDRNGKLKLKIISSQQCIPIWRDDEHTDLESMIHKYDLTGYDGKQRKIITKVVHYTETEVIYYELHGGKLIPDIEANDGAAKAHYKKGDEEKGWGKVPFIAFKNNINERSDLTFIKSLIDSYDEARSDISNYLEEVKNLIYVLKGYGGTDKGAFLNDLNYFRAIVLDDEEGSVETLTPKIDIAAAKENYEQLKRDINEFGQSYSKDLDKFGSAPSGVALEIMFQGLDLKCNKLETEFKMAFDDLMYFVNVYLSESGRDTNKTDIDIVFNRSTPVDELAKINECIASKNLVSDSTLLANHPWVTDIEYELAELLKQQETQQKIFGSYDFKNVNEG